ncbi:MAG: ABC transporter permease [Tannerella sp.]|jgi:putative ABC transport system permease protein|nr:ABC transporter permease [Tannerella sp.]
MSKYILYFKQAWQLMRQEKLFSAIYIVGTGLSITVVMVLSIVFYIKIANVYPETNRDRTLIVLYGAEESEGNSSSGMISVHLIETCFRSLESAETVTAVYNTWGNEDYVQPEGSNEQLPVTAKYVDDRFWTVFPFRFVNGKPFTEADFSSAIPTAVIAESLAKRLFGSADAEGKQVSLNFRQFRVCGVVKDASYATERSYAQLWAPYTVEPNHKLAFGQGNSLGPMSAFILAPSAGEVELVREEALDNIKKYNRTLDKTELSLHGQPDRQWQALFRITSNGSPDFNKIRLQYLFVFLILLLVPAVSLSGMTDSRMERRLSEIGVRRAFGAPVSTTVIQIITENLLFSLIGGLAGLLFSYLAVWLGRSWIMILGGTVMAFTAEGTEVTVSPAMLMNFTVFSIALGICFVLNLLSALIPAWKSAHRPIVHSLNAKL